MIYVGIDVASEKHDVCIMSEEGKIYGKKFQIQNSRDEYKKLLSLIKEAKKLFKDSKVSIGIESTGVYSSTILNYLSTIENVEVIFINPVLTNMFQLGEKVHYAKTDSIDSEGICNYLKDKKNKLFTYTPPSYQILQIKSLYREMIKLNKLINQSKNRLTGIIHVVFPEFLSVFKKIKGNLVLSLLKEYPTPNELNRKHLSTLIEFSRKQSKGHFKEYKIKELLDYSKCSVGVYTSSDALLIKQLATLILLYEEQKNEIIQELVKLVKEVQPNILTIPGIGANTAAGILGEIGNISNFRNADALTAFAGLNPLVYQSGKYEARHTKISKKGSSYLRNALCQVACSIIKYDQTFRAYYSKKRLEGKSYNCSIGHITKKIIRVVFTILKNNIEFKSINN